MATPYQEEFEKVVKETYEELCKKYKSPELQAGFEIFAANVTWKALHMKPRIPVTRTMRGK